MERDETIFDMVRRIRQHFADELTATELHHSPFPHLILPSALPPDVFEAVLRDNPFRLDPGTSFGSAPGIADVKYANGLDKRFDVAITPGAAPTSPTLAAIGEAFASGQWLFDVLVARFPEYFSLRFGDAIGHEGFWDSFRREVFVQRHEPGFFLTAHTDIPTRVASMVFSFADREGFDHCGTQLLAPKDPLHRCWGNDHHPIDQFEVVKVAPYRPNSCVVFFKTRHSFHAVAPDAVDAPNGRYSMQIQVFEPEGGALVDLSEPGLYRNRQQRRSVAGLARRVRGKASRMMAGSRRR